MRVTLPRVVGAEWTKLRSLRSTWITLAFAVVSTLALAAAFGWANRRGGGPPTVAHAIDVSFLGLDLLALIVGVVGVACLTGEYGSGLIRASLGAVPRRWPLLVAKAIVLVAVVWPLSVVLCVGSFLLAQAFAGPRGVSLGDPGALGAVLGASCYPVATALLGLGLGAVVRHTAGAVTAFVVALLVIPALLPAALPERVGEHTLKYVPVAAAQALYTRGQDGPVHLLSAGWGGVVLAGWVAVFLACGLLVLRRRDS